MLVVIVAVVVVELKLVNKMCMCCHKYIWPCQRHWYFSEN